MDLDSPEPRLSALMRASLAGDAAAYRDVLSELAALLRRYFTRRLGASRGADAEDLVQETLMAIHTRRTTYDSGRPVTAWVHAIARYKLADHHRYRNGGAGADVSLDDMEDFLPAPDEAEAAMVRRDVGKLLDALPVRSRTLIRQVRLEGQSISETAASSGLSESLVKVSIHRGLKALAARVGGGKHRAGND